jgi:hypothetical protein
MVFNLMYPAEMDHLYWKPEYGGDKPDLDGLDDAENVRAMAGIVGNEARNAAGTFLEECANKTASHWESLKILKIETHSRHATMASYWEFQARLKLRQPKNAAKIWYGASIDEFKAHIVPWLYGRGGRAWENLAKRTLSKRVHSGSGDGLVFDRGTIALACIPLLPTDHQGFDVDRDPLVAKVVECFTAIQAKDLEALARPIGDNDD